MLYFHYCKKGTPINDFLLEEEYKKVLAEKNNSEMHFWYSTDNIFMRVKVGIVKKDLDYKDVTFIFEDKEIRPNEYGAIIPYPNGFCDVTVTLAEELLRTAMKMRKAKMENK